MLPITRLTTVHPSRMETSKPPAAQASARGKTGSKNLAIPDEKAIPKDDATQTKIRTRHCLSLSKARRISGAKMRTTGPKNSQKPGLLERTPAKNINGRTCAKLWLADVPVSAKRSASVYVVASRGDNRSARKGKTGSPVHTKFRK